MSLASIVAERATIIPAADPIEERLTCNLLPIAKLPDWVYTAPLNAETRRHFRSHVNKKALCDLIEKAARESDLPARRIPQFRLSGDTIYSFYPLNKRNSIFRPIIVPTRCVRKSPSDYLENSDSQNLLISLLNMAIQSHAKSIGLLSSFEAGRGWRYYFPPGHGKVEKYVDWIPSGKTARRTVSKPLRPDDPKTEWLHAGAYLDVVELAGRLFLKNKANVACNPRWPKPKNRPGCGRIVNRWTNRERNLSILYHIRFWTTVFRAGQTDIEAENVLGNFTIQQYSRPTSTSIWDC